MTRQSIPVAPTEGLLIFGVEDLLPGDYIVNIGRVVGIGTVGIFTVVAFDLVAEWDLTTGSRDLTRGTRRSSLVEWDDPRRVYHSSEEVVVRRNSTPK